MKTRSLLYVPASSTRFIAKAHTRGADVIILDLEDSVSAENKLAARSALASSIASVRQGGAAVYVRINADETGLADAEAALSGGADALYLPKASPERIDQIDRVLAEAESNTAKQRLPLVALIEDAAALLNADRIAAHPRVIGLSCGGEDLANALGARPDADVLRLPKQLIHYAAKAHGRRSYGLFQSTADYADLDRLKQGAEEARRFGFDGASCVHPSAVPILNAAFGPSPDEIAWAQKVLAGVKAHGDAAFAIDGQMVDAPVVGRARSILAES